MSTYLLVHGAWHGAWCWERVAADLAGRGHRVVTPTLTGIGERAGEATRDVGVRTHVDDVVAALRAEEEPVVLVGHSYGGLVGRGAADREPDRVERLVAVEGWLGADGTSLFDLAPDWFADGLRTAAAERGDGWLIPPLPPALLGITDPDDVAWVEANVTPQPMRTFSEPTALSGAVDGVPGLQVVGDPGPLPFDQWAADVGYPVRRIAGGHDLMVTSPRELAAALEDPASG